MTQLTILGAGNIAFAIASGLIDTGISPNSITAADPSEAQRDKFGELGMNVTVDNQAAVANADLVLISVKPDVVEQICRQVSSVAAGKTFISVAAGITSSSLQSWLGTDSVVRCMPNTPALVRQGMIGLYAGNSVDKSVRDAVTALFTPAGKTCWFDKESEMDAVTAVSGSGPAYFFLVMEAMQEAAIDLGLSPQAARLLVQQTALGAAQMALSSEDEVAVLRQRVTSKGGTTHAALTVLEEKGLRSAFSEALKAANQRSIELSGQ
jgi:pyrroline-5-carboxylate reductase